MIRFFPRAVQYLILAAILAVAAVFLAPILKTPLMGDDAFNSGFSGFMAYEHLTPWQWYLAYTHDVAVTNGRFFPGMAFIQVIKFTLTHDALPLKIANIAAICLNIATLFVLVARVAGRRTALLASLLVVATLQERAFYESITEITVENQVVLEIIFLTLLAAVAYAQRPSAWRLGILTLLYFVSNATYEISYPFIAAYVGLPLIYGQRRAALRAGVALGIVFLAFVAMNVVLRHAVGIPSDSEYAIKPSVGGYFVTLYDQLVSAFPLTYILINPGGFFVDRATVVFAIVHVGALVGIAAALIGLAIVLDRRLADRTEDEPHSEAAAWFLGACLFVLPALLIPLSQRWQKEVQFGLPYQPAYAEGFGIAVLLAVAIVTLQRRFPRAGRAAGAVAALAIGFVVLVTYQANAKVYQIFAKSWLYPLQVMNAAEERGVLNAVPQGSTILFDSNYGFQQSDSGGYSGTRYQIFMHAHRRYDLWTLTDPKLDPRTLCAQPIRDGACPQAVSGLYYYRVRGTGPEQGTALVLHVDRFSVPDVAGEPLTPWGSTATLYVQAPRLSTLEHASIADTGFEWKTVADAEHYALWSGRSACGGDVAAPAADPGHFVTFRFGAGFYPEEGPATGPWHWGRGNDRLELVNNTDRTQKVDARILFETYAPGKFTLHVAGATGDATLPLSAAPVPFAIKRTMRPEQIEMFALSTDGARVPTKTDPRDLRLQAFGWTIAAVPGGCAMQTPAR